MIVHFAAGEDPEDPDGVGDPKGQGYPLPSDAVIVPSSYEPPEQAAAETALGDFDPERTSADMEREISRRVDLVLAKRTQEKKLQARRKEVDDAARGKKSDDAPEVEPEVEPEDAEDAEDAEGDGTEPEGTDPGEEDILGQPIRSIVPQLAELSTKKLEDLLKREQEGQGRKGLAIEIEAALEDRS